MYHAERQDLNSTCRALIAIPLADDHVLSSIPNAVSAAPAILAIAKMRYIAEIVR